MSTGYRCIRAHYKLDRLKIYDFQERDGRSHFSNAVSEWVM